jgi:hypothetical protein
MLASDEAMVAWSKEGSSEDIPSVLSLFMNYEVRQILSTFNHHLNPLSLLAVYRILKFPALGVLTQKSSSPPV